MVLTKLFFHAPPLRCILTTSLLTSQSKYQPPSTSDQLAISATLQAQHSSFIALANKTATLDAELQKIKTTYRQLWRAKTGSARDPFNEQDRSSGTTSEFGLEGLKIGV